MMDCGLPPAHTNFATSLLATSLPDFATSLLATSLPDFATSLLATSLPDFVICFGYFALRFVRKKEHFL